tara:strand:- start:2219 stop:2473 length:255 start_codon:yes stop_codon:yes gene_type:complete
MYLQFFFKQKEFNSYKSSDNKKSSDNNSDEIGSDQTNSQNRQQQITQIEEYVDSFLKNFMGQTLNNIQSSPVPKEAFNNKNVSM